MKLEVPLLPRKQFLVMPCQLLKHEVAADGSALYTALMLCVPAPIVVALWRVAVAGLGLLQG